MKSNSSLVADRLLQLSPQSLKHTPTLWVSRTRRPRLYGEKLSRVEGSPAYPSYLGEPTFHTQPGQLGQGETIRECVATF